MTSWSRQMVVLRFAAISGSGVGWTTISNSAATLVQPLLSRVVTEYRPDSRTTMRRVSSPVDQVCEMNSPWSSSSIESPSQISRRVDRITGSSLCR